MAVEYRKTYVWVLINGLKVSFYPSKATSKKSATAMRMANFIKQYFCPPPTKEPVWKMSGRNNYLNRLWKLICQQFNKMFT